MKDPQYIVRRESESTLASTFDEALRIAQRLREKTGRPVDVLAPGNQIVASFAAAVGTHHTNGELGDA